MSQEIQYQSKLEAIAIEDILTTQFLELKQIQIRHRRLSKTLFQFIRRLFFGIYSQTFARRREQYYCILR
ncbi:unnamed protein product [Paramecium sonneborni]|uniref:Uncharacterized protein n=1 Tax=Paramecium sonneborni TaxID=65129 RepID=A0A8S1RNL2_9CILI|nr:unnamed protein product [Paramecium sonneborni]